MVPTRAIFLFLDGVGLGGDDPAVNPMAAVSLPTLAALLDEHPITASTGRLSTARAELIPTDATLGVAGRPQSATGQATILSGINAAARLGEHYGPRPDARVRAVLDEGNLFRRLGDADRSAYFCNAYPQRYFEHIASGRRLLSAIPYAATQAGQRLATADNLRGGSALAADFTNQGWRDELGYTDVPVYTPEEAGRQLWRIAQPHRFVFFEHWLTDLLGHRGQLALAIDILQRFDGFLAGLLAAIEANGAQSQTLVIISSDHGNIENCADRKHTRNPVPTILLGGESAESRRALADEIHSLADFAPLIERFLR